MAARPSLAVDHLLVACDDVAKTQQAFSNRFGAAFADGGAHPGQGTRNALGAIGDGVYLELLGPDPSQSVRADWLAGAQDGAVFHWAARCDDLGAVADVLAAQGLAHSGIIDGARTAADGARLTWKLLFPAPSAFGAVMPFFIDWLDTDHPSLSAPDVGVLKDWMLKTPEAPALNALFNAFETALAAQQSARASLQAVVAAPSGEVVLHAADPVGRGVSPFA
ncbi:MAG: VOC family protein [Pseudomonadota bacterium]